ncbi:MAG: ABC transporter substrate-binding protein, partial [Egibacteraceae bacterium]
GEAGQATAAGQAAFPVTVTDCGGRETTYEKPPERVFALDDWAADLLVVLGLQDRMVAYARYLEGDRVWAEYRDELLAIEAVTGEGSNYPALEAVVALSPDFVVSVFDSAFAESSGLPDRDGWAEFGASAYQTLGDCEAAGTVFSDFSSLFLDLRQLGQIFGVPDRAEEVIAGIEQRLDAVAERIEGRPVVTMMSYSGEEDPFPAGGSGIPNAVMTLAGVENVFADLLEPYVTVSWEEVVNRDPDVIWVMTDAGGDLGFIDEEQGIKDKLLADTRVADMTAVNEQAFVTVSFDSSGVSTPRNIDALEHMVGQLEALR